MKSLLVQLIRKGELASVILLHELSDMTKDELNSVETLEKMTNYVLGIMFSLENAPGTMLILDGLDECTRTERRSILAWVTNMLRSSAKEPDSTPFEY